MPDWTYRTVFRPALFSLGARGGRNLALGAMGRLARFPLGRSVIQFMGHMRPDRRLTFERSSFRAHTPVGLGSALDPQMRATRALAEFGFGFLEVGPIVAQPDPKWGPLQLDVANETVVVDSPAEALSPIIARDRLLREGPLRLPVLARIEPDTMDQATEMSRVLTDAVDGWVLPVERYDACQLAFTSGDDCSNNLPLFLSVDAGSWSDDDVRQTCGEAIEQGQVRGLVIATSVSAKGQATSQALGKSGFVAALAATQSMREIMGREPLLIAAVGVHSPEDALDYLRAGADLVQVDTGLAFAGPGLPKRINAAVLYRQHAHAEREDRETKWGTEAWFWALLMGLGMLIGGLMALAIAATRVVLPYDEAMVGLSRDELMQVNDRLLSFMTHDRVTLAGTMLAVGWIYMTLAWFGARRGVHWAVMAIVVSAFAGFFGFFSFLGFGYFDPFHAFVTAILFPILLLTIHSHVPPRHTMEAPELWNDGRWQASLWGQLSFVIHGAILIVAGTVITIVGMTSVFVPEDLAYMDTTAAALRSAHPQLVPLVAHDRATFGGMLISCGAVTLLSAMWGFQRGQAWLWWALMGAGTVAYGATIAVHWCVGYDALKHLLPAYGGLALLWVGGLASYRFLVAPDRRLQNEWEQQLRDVHASDA